MDKGWKRMAGSLSWSWLFDGLLVFMFGPLCRHMQDYEASTMEGNGEGGRTDVRANQVFLESMLSSIKALLDHNAKVIRYPRTTTKGIVNPRHDPACPPLFLPSFLPHACMP